MSLGTTAEWFGGMTFGNWYQDSLGMSHFTTIASITECWQGMMSVLKDFFEFDRSKNTLVPTPIRVLELKGSGLVV